eukprot:5894321-Pyramimonas_sp.AAC.1
MVTGCVVQAMWSKLWNAIYVVRAMLSCEKQLCDMLCDTIYVVQSAWYKLCGPSHVVRAMQRK